MTARPQRRRYDRLTAPDVSPDETTAAHIIAPVDRLAEDMARKWGEERLPGLVSIELAERFGRQRAKFEAAVASDPPDLDTLRTEAARMLNAYRALDHAATQANAPLAFAEAWEFVAEDGTPAAIIRDARTWKLYAERHPDRRVYTLEEAGRVLTSPHLRLVSAAKDAFPGATVSAVKPRKHGAVIDDDIPFAAENRP